MGKPMIDPQTLADSGVLLVDKPADWTSHDVVNCVRRRFRIAKVGHCGTLDPAATGLLVLVLGLATKLSGTFTDHDKTYEGTIRLGIETHSHDAEGKVVAARPLDGVDEAAIRAACQKLVGEIWQTPPMVSAIKKDGKPLYKLARQGIEVERAPRQVTIHELVVQGVALPDFDLRVRCTKGTYVRVLAADIGAMLGCGAHLLRLRRLASGPFEVAAAVTLDQIKSWEREQLFERVIPLARMASMAENGWR